MTINSRFQEQKVTEAASILLQLEGGEMPYLKLVKLLYLADRLALQEWERPITYDSYVSMNYGPVLSTTYDLIKGQHTSAKTWKSYIERQGKYNLKLIDKPPKNEKLSQAEIDVLERVYREYGSYNQFHLSKITHDFPEFKDPSGSSAPISIEEILKGIGYDPSDIERIDSEIQEESDIVTIFGG